MFPHSSITRPDSLGHRFQRAHRRAVATSRPWVSLFHATMLIVLASVIASAPASSQVSDATLWGANNDVRVLAIAGRTLYLTGSFTAIGPMTGFGAPLSASTGRVLQPFSQVTGSAWTGVVSAAVSDGAGGWFIGGSFTSVGGVPRSNLAHLLADGSVSPWNPQPDYQVDALVMNGGILYAGGRFWRVNGVPHRGLVAIDATTGAVSPWNPIDGNVSTLAASGNVLYVGGSFGTVGGQYQYNLVAFNLPSGSLRSWFPSPNSTVSGLAVSGNTVYACGMFNTIGGMSRINIAGLDATTGLATSFDPHPDSYGVNAIAVSGNIVYAGGRFQTIGGQARNRIAALDATTGQATAWNPSADYDVFVLAATTDAIYVGGQFSAVGGQTRYHVAALDPGSGAATAWNPSPNGGGGVYAITRAGNVVYVGGYFTMIGAVQRHHAAAIDLTSGEATAWDPNPDGSVYSLAVGNGVVYAGGDFATIGGVPRKNVAALDPVTGAARNWNPSADARVRALAVNAGTVYVAGEFAHVGGQRRVGIAALDPVTGLATGWDPNADFPSPGDTTQASPYYAKLYALAVNGSTIYVGGYCNRMGGEPRSNLAALDLTTGAATPWNPAADSYVNVLAVNGNVVFAAGGFNSIGGQPRHGAGALDPVTGDATGWDPAANGGVYTLSATGATILAGGGFSGIGGQSVAGIAELDAMTGAATAWNAQLGGNTGYSVEVYATAASSTAAYVGGYFGSAGGVFHGNVARVSADFPTPVLLTRFDAEASVDGIALRWQFSSPDIAATVERATSEAGPWTTLALTARDEGGVSVGLDSTAEPGTAYWYRLVVSQGAESPTTFGSVRAARPRVATVSGLTPLAPNPAPGHAHIGYVVAKREPVRLRVVDVAGRVVAVLAEGWAEPGRYSVEWDGGSGGHRIAAGLYFVRWESPGVIEQRRLVVIR